MGEHICDRCGKEYNGLYDNGGNCTCCGDNLCEKCAGKWTEDGGCERCAPYADKTVEELERTLPLIIVNKEKKEMPCRDCKRIVMGNIKYEQRIIRFEDFHGGQHTRFYEVVYYKMHDRGVLFRTERHRGFREALIEAHQILDEKNLKPADWEHYVR
jgi:hypothetical protein